MDKFKNYRSDIKASLVVFLVALPLSLGIALASGAPLMSGVLAGIVGGLIVGLVSNSATSVSGPAAGLTVVVVSAITTLGDFYLFTTAVFLAGFFQILLGLMKAGRIGGYFPNSVIKGMLAAIGIILILKQIPHALGFDADFMGDESFHQIDGENTFTEIFKAFHYLDVKAAIISVLSLLALFYWDKKITLKNKFFSFVPAPVFVVLIGVVINEYLFMFLLGTKLEGPHIVDLPSGGGIMSFLAELRWPEWQGLTQVAVYKIAFTLAIVASLESMLSVEAVDKIDPRKNVTDKNREFIAQGIGNMVAGLVGALPVTSVIVRSSANINSGSHSKLSTILHGLWLLLAVVFFSSVLELIPLASLAAILIHIGYKLSKPSLYKQVSRLGRVQFIPFLVTIGSILFTDLLQGIFIGLIVGFIFVVRASFKRSIIVVNDGPNYLIRFLKDVSFLNKPEMIEILSHIPKGSKVIIDGTNHLYVDNDIIVIIEDFMKASEEREITFEILKSTFAINPFFKEA